MHEPVEKKRIIIAITGASGAVYGVRLLQVLKSLPGWETHLIISAAGALNIKHELAMKRQVVYQLADCVHDFNAIGACIASGAFVTEGMIIAPCSMKTLAGVAHAFADNLICRAADVVLKERRRLLLMPRETPFNLAHIRNMAFVTEMGGIIYPPMHAFYNKVDSLDVLVNETVGRVLSMFGAPSEDLFKPWGGLK